MSKSSSVLIVMALNAEGQGVFERSGIDVLYTGLGKVNASMMLMRRLIQQSHTSSKPSLVINFGSAGSRRFKTGTLVSCTNFVQRDMDVGPLGFAHGVTPFEDIPSTLEFPNVFPDLPVGICGTGDSFEIGEPRITCDVVDMEAYALAKVCYREGLQFSCVKYISDGADDTAAQDWQDNVHKAADAFLHLYQSLKRGDMK